MSKQHVKRNDNGIQTNALRAGWNNQLRVEQRLGLRTRKTAHESDLLRAFKNANSTWKSKKAFDRDTKFCQTGFSCTCRTWDGAEHTSLVWTPRVIVRCKYVNITRRISNMSGMSKMMRVTVSTSSDALVKTKKEKRKNWNLSKSPGHRIACCSWTS